MESRIDKYKDDEYKPSRVEKNKDLYKMIYSAYDKFENYKVPLEEKEIDLSNIKKEITSRDEYMKLKKYGEFTNNRIVSREEYDDESNKSEEEVYDIKELLDKVKNDNPSSRKTEIREEKYLDRLHLKDNAKTNLEKMKEEYEEVILDNDEEEKLSNTANLSLEILSDLKSGGDTVVTPPMKSEDEDTEDDIPFKRIKKEEKEEVEEKPEKNNNNDDEEVADDSFYSDIYKFKKKDFEEDDDDDEDEEEYDDEETEEGNKFLFRILVILSIIILMGLIAIYIIGYFSK